MGDITISDGLLLAYFLLSGFYAAFMVGGKATKLIILWLFCRTAKLEDLAWELFTIIEMRYGKLKGQQSYTIQGKEYAVRIMRKTPEPAAASPEPKA